MSWLAAPARVSPQTAQANPSGRTERASDCAFAGEGVMSIDADQDPPDGLRATRTCAGLVRASIQAALRLPAASTPMRGLVCAVVPGSSLIFTFADQLAAPLVKLEKKMSTLPLRESCQTAYAVLAESTATSGKSLSALVLSVTFLFGHQLVQPVMLSWLA